VMNLDDARMVGETIADILNALKDDKGQAQ
jgi:hypothetical protein